MNLQEVRTVHSIGIVEVPNPAEFAERRVNPTVKAIRTLRDDPLGLMHDRHQISEAQYAAGRQWQAAYEAAGAKVKSSGFLQEPVDGSPPVKIGVTDRQMRAAFALAQYSKELGRDGDAVVHLVLADKLSLREVANRRHIEASSANVTYVGHRFRECLTLLAKMMGMST